MNTYYWKRILSRSQQMSGFLTSWNIHFLHNWTIRDMHCTFFFFFLWKHFFIVCGIFVLEKMGIECDLFIWEVKTELILVILYIYYVKK